MFVNFTLWVISLWCSARYGLGPRKHVIRPCLGVWCFIAECALVGLWVVETCSSKPKFHYFDDLFCCTTNPQQMEVIEFGLYCERFTTTLHNVVAW